MKIKIFFTALASLFCIAIQAQVNYPKTKKVAQADDYFGTKVEDPYRWLEDDNSPETAEWVKEENKVTFDYLSKIPYREKIRQRLTQIWNFEKMTAPFKKGDYYFFYKNDGIQNQSVLYVQKGLTGTPRVLIDPNKLSAEGTTALTSVGASKNAGYLAYGIAKAGSDWNEIYVVDVISGQKLNDKLEWVKFSSISWRGNGFYYSRYDAPIAGKERSKKNENHKIFYHRIGEDQAKDVLVYEDKAHPLRNFTADITEEEDYLIISGSEGTSGNNLIFKDLVAPNADFVTVVDNFENDYDVLTVVKNNFLVRTNYKAPRYKIISIPVDKSARENWKDVIPENTSLLENASLCNNKIVIDYIQDVTSRLQVFSIKGEKEKDIPLSGLCKIESFISDIKDSLAFYSVATFTAPPIIYKYNVNTNVSTLFFKSKFDFKTEDYETSQVFFSSKDGTKVPMFLTHKKGIKLDGTNPVFLFGYGGFNMFYAPELRIDRCVFIENGGIYAVANIRGGGEYGEEWHKAGIQQKKQNVFDDFIAAAEYLIANKYTNREKLAIHGRSNGGLLVGAVITQRPDLCKVAIPTVGVMDMLRYHKFTIGWAWAGDYGKSDEEVHFKNLIRYSPLHNIKEAEYPATLITTGDHDDRVVPAHSFKFAAALQEKQKGKNPVLIRIDTNAGHGSGKPISKQIDEFTDIWSFVFYNLGMDIK